VPIFSHSEFLSVGQATFDAWNREKQVYDYSNRYVIPRFRSPLCKSNFSPGCASTQRRRNLHSRCIPHIRIRAPSNRNNPHLRIHIIKPLISTIDSRRTSSWRQALPCCWTSTSQRSTSISRSPVSPASRRRSSMSKNSSPTCCGICILCSNAGACILDQRRSSFIYLASDHNPSEEEPFAILNLTTQTRPVLKNQGPIHPLGLTSSPSLRTATIGRSAVFDPTSPSSQV
jgi:hypothetical protein